MATSIVPDAAGRYRIERYNKTRFWAVWCDDALVAVVVYRRGARELLRRLAAIDSSALQ